MSKKEPKKKPRKARCVLCGKRIWFASGGEGTKSGKPVCWDCQGFDGITC